MQYMDIYKEVYQRQVPGLFTLILWIGQANGFSESEGLELLGGPALSCTIFAGPKPHGCSRGMVPSIPTSGTSCRGSPELTALAGRFSSPLLFIMALKLLSSLRGGGFRFTQVAQW